MRQILPAIGALLFSVLLLMAGDGLQKTLVPLRAQLESFTSAEVGLLGSSYFLGFALGGYFGPALFLRSGHIRTFAAMVAIASAVFLIYAMTSFTFIWWALRFATGVCFAVLYVTIESWLNERATNETRGGVFAIYAVTSWGAAGLGQVLLPLAPLEAFTLFSVASILVSVAAVPVALTRSAQPSEVKHVEIRLAKLYRLSPVGFIGCFAVGAANGAFWSFSPIYAQAAGGSAALVATFMSIVIFTGAGGQWPLGYLSDRIDRRLVIAGSGVVAAAIGVALFFRESWEPGTVLILVGVFGFFAFPIYTITVAHVNDFVEPDSFVEAASGLALIWGAGAVFGPLIVAYAIGVFGVEALFAVTAAIHAALACFALYRMFQRARVGAEERGKFIDAVRVGKTVAPIDATGAQPDAAPSPDPQGGASSDNPR